MGPPRSRRRAERRRAARAPHPAPRRREAAPLNGPLRGDAILAARTSARRAARPQPRRLVSPPRGAPSGRGSQPCSLDRADQRALPCHRPLLHSRRGLHRSARGRRCRRRSAGGRVRQVCAARDQTCALPLPRDAARACLRRRRGAAPIAPSPLPPPLGWLLGAPAVRLLCEPGAAHRLSRSEHRCERPPRSRRGGGGSPAAAAARPLLRVRDGARGWGRAWLGMPRLGLARRFRMPRARKPRLPGRGGGGRATRRSGAVSAPRGPARRNRLQPSLGQAYWRR
mmetsp:Transcript_1355/g.4316  ORF Transcript_1355/g.4316 Transcript_1355/m.4316 type:complete len:283 (-) Transcript_1355:520-1368(-)